ncbi:GIY-YIG nuclease family protein [Phenylobacterium sp. LjRoot225]|uniref:GIY-YIG nuclease family protein n=1 Tax=Phenylobacterium sp. LjRoot225 TaxID=3342285 RepID=UPI003ECF6E4E
MEKSARRAVVAAYKEARKTAGVYAVRCAATGEVWVGRSADLAAQQNSLDFQLRHGPNNPAMRRAWTAHGASSLQFKPPETAPDTLTPAGCRDLLKARALHLRQALGAAAI